MSGFTAYGFAILAICAAGVSAKGEVVVLHSPISLEWRDQTNVHENMLKEIYSASLGFSIDTNTNWSGLMIKNPFQTPEAVVEVFIDGVPSLGDALNAKIRYPLVLDRSDVNTFEVMRQRINQRFNDGENTLVHMSLSNPIEVKAYKDIFGQIKMQKEVKRSLEYLKPDTVDEDAQFLQELNVLDQITEKLVRGFVSDNFVDFYELRIMSLHPLSDFHGSDSDATKEAYRLLGESLQQLSDAFAQAYSGLVVVVAVCSDAAHTRRSARSILESATADAVTKNLELWNVSESYSEDYPVIFNIMLWFGVVFAFALLSIVYAIMDMDPGRDSIIYRMTSNRMKKDN